MNSKERSFEIYRYQLLPINSEQLELPAIVPEKQTYDFLINNKNAIFNSILDNLKSLYYTRTDLVLISEKISDDIYTLKIGAKKEVEIFSKTLIPEEKENWPNVLVVIYNDSNIQKIAIEKNIKSFTSTNVVANILEDNFSNLLLNHKLNIFIKPTFYKKDFWTLVEKYDNKIIKLSFDIISPNLSEISKTLHIDLKKGKKENNIQKSTIQFQSDKNSALKIKKGNTLIDSLVDYSSEGGGGISIRVKGIKKTITTANNIIEHSIDNIELTGKKSEDIIKVYKGLFE